MVDLIEGFALIGVNSAYLSLIIQMIDNKLSKYNQVT